MWADRLHKALSPLAWYGGVYRRDWRSLARRRGLTAVLCYHRVVASDERRKAGLTVDEGITSATFEAQIRFMLRHFEPVHAHDAALPSAAGRPRFAVTFDDGYADNHDVAAPVLQRLGVPATFYVVSECVGEGRRFWWDRLAAFVRDTPLTTLDTAGLLADADADADADAGAGAGAQPLSLPPTLALHDADARRLATDRLGAVFRQLDPADVEATLERLRRVLRSDDRALPGDRLMDWTEVRRLAALGFSIGAHSADHLNLARLDAASLERQVAGAKRRIEDETGQRVTTFAYPYGGPANYSRATMDAVRRAGYDAAFTAISGVVTGQQDVAELPRVALNWPYDFACAHNLDTAIRATR